MSEAVLSGSRFRLEHEWIQEPISFTLKLKRLVSAGDSDSLFYVQRGSEALGQGIGEPESGAVSGVFAGPATRTVMADVSDGRGDGVLRVIRGQLAYYNLMAAADDGLPITSEAQARLVAWAEQLSGSLVGHAEVSWYVSGTAQGGSSLVMDHARTGRRFTLRFGPRGEFFMASGVYGNLRSQLFSEQESTPEASFQWLGG